MASRAEPCSAHVGAQQTVSLHGFHNRCTDRETPCLGSNDHHVGASVSIGVASPKQFHLADATLNLSRGSPRPLAAAPSRWCRRMNWQSTRRSSQTLAPVSVFVATCANMPLAHALLCRCIHRRHALGQQLATEIVLADRSGLVPSVPLHFADVACTMRVQR